MNTKDIPDQSVVQDASNPLKFYKVDLGNLLPIPDADTKKALVVRTNCGQVNPLPVVQLTPAQQQLYTIGPEHPRLRVIQDKSLDSGSQPGATATREKLHLFSFPCFYR